MTVKRYAGDKLVGLSSDTKPTNLPDGATFYESDTLKEYIRKDNTWTRVANTTFESSTATENGSALLDLSQTWDAGANTVTGIKLNVTDTSSNSTSTLMDLKVDDVSRFSVDKNGSLFVNAIQRPSGALLINSTTVAGASIYGNLRVQGGSFNINGRTFLHEDQEDILAQRRSNNPQTYRIYGTYTDSSNYERLSISANSTASYIQTENLGTGNAKDLYLGANNTTQMVVSANGNVGIGTVTADYQLHLKGGGTTYTNTRLGLTGGDGIGEPGIYFSVIGASTRRLYYTAGNAGLNWNSSFYITNDFSALGSQINLGSQNFSNDTRVSISGKVNYPVYIHFQAPGSYQYGVLGMTGTASSYDLVFRSGAGSMTNGTERFRITSSGNVGIGTTTPATGLHLLNSSINGSIFTNETSYSGAPVISRFKNTVSTWDLGLLGDGTNDFKLKGYFGNTIPFIVENGAPSNTLVLKYNTGNVGIGTTSPTSKLTVAGNVDIGGNALVFGPNKSYIYGGLGIVNTLFGGGDFTIRDASLVTKFIVNQSGNVGIGTSSPSKKLSILGSIGDNSTLYMKENTYNGEIIMMPRSYPVGGNQLQFIGLGPQTIAFTVASNTILTEWNGTRYGILHPNGGDLQVSSWLTSITGKLDINTTASASFVPLTITAIDSQFNNIISVGKQSNPGQIFTINSSGNVGIGTTSPQAKLDVAGDVSSSGNYITGNVANKGFWVTGNAIHSGMYNAGGLSQLGFKVNSLEGMRLTSTGLGIGATSPSAKLHISSNTGEKIRIQDTLLDGAANFITFHDVGGETAVVGHFSSGDEHFKIRNQTTNGNITLQTNGNYDRLTVTSTGKVGIGTVTPSYPLEVSSTNNIVSRFISQSLTGGIGLRVESTDTNQGLIDLRFTSVGSPDIDIDSNLGTIAYLNILCQNVKNIQLGQTFAGGQNLSVAGNLQIGIDSLSTGTGAFEIVKGNNYNGRIGSDGTSLFHITNSGNVGIGTNSPNAVLDLVTGNSTGAGSGETYGIRIQDGSNFANDQPRSLRFGLMTSGNGAGYIQYSFEGSSFGNDNGLLLNPLGGLVAVGHNGPKQQLDVGGNILVRGGSAGNQPGGKIGFTLLSNVYGGGMPASIQGYFDKPNWYQGVALTFNTISGSDVSGSQGLERMRISSDGNVGIGTTTPSYPLDVIGGIRSTYQTTSIVHGFGNTLIDLIGINGSNPGTNDGRLHIGYNENDPTIRINSSGVMVYSGIWNFDIKTWFGVGITSTHSTPFILDGMTNGVSNGITTDIIKFTQRDVLFAKFYDAGSGLNEFHIWQQADTNNYIYLRPGRDSIFNGGNVGIGTTTPATTLDVEGPIKHKVYTVTTLPAAATVGAGSRAFVSDANATTFHSVVVTGGSNFVPVFSDGTNWRIG